MVSRCSWADEMELILRINKMISGRSISDFISAFRGNCRGACTLREELITRWFIKMIKIKRSSFRSRPRRWKPRNQADYLGRLGRLIATRPTIWPIVNDLIDICVVKRGKSVARAFRKRQRSSLHFYRLGCKVDWPPHLTGKCAEMSILIADGIDSRGNESEREREKERILRNTRELKRNPNSACILF